MTSTIPPRSIVLHYSEKYGKYLITGSARKDQTRSILGAYATWFHALEFGMQVAASTETEMYLTIEGVEVILLGD